MKARSSRGRRQAALATLLRERRDALASPISEARLRALPFTALCRHCQEQRETLPSRTRSVGGASGSRPHAL